MALALARSKRKAGEGLIVYLKRHAHDLTLDYPPGIVKKSENFIAQRRARSWEPN
jgi:hypothetical protein